jgi:uncharacterized protein involved in exopolysaccharide biosynthesis
MLMLQKSRQQGPYEDLGQDRGHDQGLFQYVEIAKRRLLYFVVPFFLISIVGAFVTMLWPARYVSEGKILVESQAIPADLVRPTVTTIANERIQVIEQRIMTRENLLAIVDKFGVFADRRQLMSGTELLDSMRERTYFRPLEVKRQGSGITIAFTVGFEHERPEIAMRVANEFVTLVLNEDARSRTARAVETTKFLAREVKRLEGELGSIEAKISEFKLQPSGAVPDQIALQLATLRAEIFLKASVYSDTHPELVALKRRLAALEQVISQTRQVETGVDALQRQHSAIQKDLESTTQKLSAARLGESLERDQQSERLDVIEQPTMPQKPIKPNRLRIFALALAMAAMAGVGGVLAVEMFDRTIRGRQDLFSVADSHLVVASPFIATRAEALRKKGRLLWAAGIVATALLAGLVVFHFLVYPLDLLWIKAQAILLG